LALVVASALRPTPARATEPTAARCPAGVGAVPAVADIDPELRLHFIAERLGRAEHKAHVWVWGWTIALGVSTVGNLIPLAFVSPEDRIDWYVGSASSLIGIVPLLAIPLDVTHDAPALRLRIASRGPTDDVCALLADAEGKLVRDAANQAAGRAWWVHAANVALNAGIGLFLGLGYHHWVAGAYNLVVGSAIGEIIIFTQPTSNIDDLRAYRAGALGGTSLAIGYTNTF
jgi:hypothetical protein